MGIRDSSKVEFVLVNSGASKIAVSVNLDGAQMEAGTIHSVNPDKVSGWIYDAKKQKIPFQQPYLNELGLDVGSACDFTQADDGGTATAVALVASERKRER